MISINQADTRLFQVINLIHNSDLRIPYFVFFKVGYMTIP